MMTPELLILDEPTSELDPIGKEEVFDAVRRLRDEQNVTIIMIEHAVEQLAEFADRIFVMDAGKIVAEAPPRELFRNVELFHRTGGERLPQVAELLFALEQEGIITPEQFTPYEAEAVTVLSQILGAHHG
jgi:ABC-type multidrug transport system ATPase subunit